MFVSLFYAILDTQSGRLVFSNGGHNPPLFVRAGGDARFLDAKPGCVLGALDTAVYEDARSALAPGDTLMLYTDGVTEAMNGADELYGEKRLQELLRDPAGSPRTLIDGVIADVKRHSGETTQSDDITLLAVAYRGGRDA
jgi:sigma-B regulation protein RsbU (phosphoserine phosphatase)